MIKLRTPMDFQPALNFLDEAIPRKLAEVGRHDLHLAVGGVRGSSGLIMSDSRFLRCGSGGELCTEKRLWQTNQNDLESSVAIALGVTYVFNFPWESSYVFVKGTRIAGEGACILFNEQDGALGNQVCPFVREFWYTGTELKVLTVGGPGVDFDVTVQAFR